MQLFDSLHEFAQNTWVYGGTFVLVLSILVFVHEFGHYYIARVCGVRIESFSIGFGKELFGYTDKHGTRWKFSLIPLGGYVKMFGDVDPTSAGHTTEVSEGGAVRQHTDAERKVSFYGQSVARRAAIVFAGPGINFLFAILIMWGLYVFYGQPSTPPVVAGVVQEAAADRAGFQPYDRILSIDGRPVRRFEELRRSVVLGLDEDRVFEIQRGGEVVKISVRPDRLTQEDRFGFSNSQGFLGVVGPGNGFDVNRISAVNGVPVKDAAQARTLLRESMGRETSIAINQGDKTDVYKVKPPAVSNETFDVEGDTRFNHLVLTQDEKQLFFKLAPLEGLMVAVNETKNVLVDTLSAIWQMITGTRSAKELGGIIRIGALAGDMAQTGIIALITFTALLSINLGLINLFPIPMLDGGHLLFYAIESIKGKPISEQIQEYAFRLGLVFLVGIMVFANLNDLLQIFL